MAKEANSNHNFLSLKTKLPVPPDEFFEQRQNVSQRLRRIVECRLGCFKIAPLSNFITAQQFSDGVLAANYEFDIIFNFDVILRVHASIVCVIF